MLPDTPALLLFVTASIALLVTPGPAVLYIVARSVDQGRLAGIVSTLGVATGSLVMIAATALGVAALIASSAFAFTLLKYLGAAYLVYIGVRRLLTRDPVPGDAPPPRRRLSRIFWQGVVVNVLNPKTALFFLAFLPQFVDPARGSAAAQIMVLGGLFALLGTFSDSLYALLAGSVGGALRRRGGFMAASRWLTGGTFIGLGVLTALAGSGREALSGTTTIERCTAPLGDDDRAALDELLRDAVANGASVGYVEVPTPQESRAYWRDVETALAAGSVLLFVARLDGRLVGTVHLGIDPRPNARHRAELKRLLVHSTARNRGIGRALVLAAEQAARAAGRRLLLLDVRPGDPAERLYRVLGWQAAGSVPDYIFEADGRLTPTLFMYRQLT